MGSNTSKINDGPFQTYRKEINIESNGNSSDPRSPTPEIIRTPLQEKPSTKHNITKNIDLRKTFDNVSGEEKLIHNNPILSAVIKNHLQSYDPRSPTQEFERTPIVLASKIDELTNDKELNYGSPCLTDDIEACNDDQHIEETNTRSDVMVPKNLCHGFFDMTLNDTLKDSEEPLGSSTASNDAIETNIKECDRKPTTLLETNFDYIEDDEQYEDSQENVETCGCTEHNNVKIPQFNILDDDPRSPTVGIDRTPIVVPKIEEEPREENVEEMSDDKLIKVLQNTNTELRQGINKTDVKNSEGLLIYEDESTASIDTPKKSKSVNNSGSRTPLSCMKNKTEGHIRSKSANTLFDPKKKEVIPSKIPKRVSHIPRLKPLSKQSKVGSNISLKNISKTSVISGDCENTPPQSNRDRWDKDNSIVL